jgi:hypothetical protein
VIVQEETRIYDLMPGQAGWLSNADVVLRDGKGFVPGHGTIVKPQRTSWNDHFVIKTDREKIELVTTVSDSNNTERAYLGIDDDYDVEPIHVVSERVMEHLPGWKPIGRTSSQAGLASMRAGTTLKAGSARITARGVRH